jgi:hypothetical protein
MATQAQIDANRANAQKSTGPRTEEGKAASCLNHLSHGFASAARFLVGENQLEFLDLIDGLSEEYRPATLTEKILVEKMAHNQWLSLRATRLQGESLHRMRPGDVDNGLGLLLRYQTTADRAFDKAHAELLKAQEQRKKSEIGFEPQKAAEAPQAAAASPAEPVNSPAQAEKITAETPEESLFMAIHAKIEEMLAAEPEDLARAA